MLNINQHYLRKIYTFKIISSTAQIASFFGFYSHYNILDKDIQFLSVVCWTLRDRNKLYELFSTDTNHFFKRCCTVWWWMHACNLGWNRTSGDFKFLNGNISELLCTMEVRIWILPTISAYSNFGQTLNCTFTFKCYGWRCIILSNITFSIRHCKKQSKQGRLYLHLRNKKVK